MYVFITILIVIASLLMILIVLVQNSKGGGLASGFSSPNQIMGVRKTTDFLEKATWGLAGAILLLSIISAAFLPKQTAGIESDITAPVMQEQIPAVEAPAAATDFAPAATTTPATEAAAPTTATPAETQQPQ